MRNLLDNWTGKLANPLTEFSYQRKGNILNVHFKAFNSSLYSFSDKDNDRQYDGDVVEIFLDFGDDYYLEIEVAPNGTKFVATILNRHITYIDSSFLKHDVIIKDNNYFVDMEIDLSKFHDLDKIKYNAFRIEVDDSKHVILEAVSPTMCETFHVRNKFINLLSEE